MLEIDEFRQLFDLYKNGVVIFHFHGDRIEGKSWCSDCVDAHNVVCKIVSQMPPGKVTLLDIAVGKKDEWKSIENPYRQDPELMLTNIPTLLQVNHGKEICRLVEDECKDEEKVREFLSSAFV